MVYVLNTRLLDHSYLVEQKIERQKPLEKYIGNPTTICLKLRALGYSMTFEQSVVNQLM